MFSWIFDKSGDQIALEPADEPVVELPPQGEHQPQQSVLVMVLYLVGISLRFSPHLSAPKVSLSQRYHSR
jgi:hypothetical protein